MPGKEPQHRPLLLIKPVYDTALVTDTHIDDVTLHNDLYTYFFVEPFYRLDAAFRQLRLLVLRGDVQPVTIFPIVAGPQKTPEVSYLSQWLNIKADAAIYRHVFKEESAKTARRRDRVRIAAGFLRQTIRAPRQQQRFSRGDLCLRGEEGVQGPVGFLPQFPQRDIAAEDLTLLVFHLAPAGYPPRHDTPPAGELRRLGHIDPVFVKRLVTRIFPGAIRMFRF